MYTFYEFCLQKEAIVDPEEYQSLHRISKKPKGMTLAKDKHIISQDQPMSSFESGFQHIQKVFGKGFNIGFQYDTIDNTLNLRVHFKFDPDKILSIADNLHKNIDSISDALCKMIKNHFAKIVSSNNLNVKIVIDIQTKKTYEYQKWMFGKSIYPERSEEGYGKVESFIVMIQQSIFNKLPELYSDDFSHVGSEGYSIYLMRHQPEVDYRPNSSVPEDYYAL